MIDARPEKRFTDYLEASRYCRAEGRAVIVQVDDEVTRLYPSGKYEPVNYRRPQAKESRR